MSRFQLPLFLTMQSTCLVIIAVADLSLDLRLGVTPERDPPSCAKELASSKAKLTLSWPHEPSNTIPNVELNLSLGPGQGLYHSHESGNAPPDLTKEELLHNHFPIFTSEVKFDNYIFPSSYANYCDSFENDMSQGKRKASCLLADQDGSETGLFKGPSSAEHRHEAGVRHSTRILPQECKPVISSRKQYIQDKLSCFEELCSTQIVAGSLHTGAQISYFPDLSKEQLLSKFQCVQKPSTREAHPEGSSAYGVQPSHVGQDPPVDRLATNLSNRIQIIPTNFLDPRNELSCENSERPFRGIEQPAFPLNPVLSGQEKTISDSFLPKYMQIYDTKVKGLIFMSQTWNMALDKHHFEGIQAVRVFLPGPLGSRTRSIVRLKSRSSSQPYVRFDKTRVRIKKLIRWLIYDYMTVLLKLGKINEFSEAKQDTLLDWLFQEFFEPQGSPPVMGEITIPISSYSRSAFGPIQSLIIDYLTSAPPPYYVHQLASSIIGIWFKNFEFHTWKIDFNDEDQKYWRLVDRVLSYEFYDIIRNFAHKRKDDSFHSAKTLGNLTIIRVNDSFCLSSSHKGKISITGKQFQKAIGVVAVFNEAMIMNDIEKNVIDDMFKSYKENVPRIKDDQIRCEGVSIVLVPKYHGKKSWVPRILNIENNLIHPKAMKIKLETFFSSLRYYHGKLISFCVYSNTEVIKGAHIELLIWLKQEMFSPQIKFPLFGTIYTNSESFNKDYFGPIQSHLVDHLSKLTTAEDLEESFTAILGYWYKNKYPGFWKEHFRDDVNYWSSMKAIITKQYP